MLLTVYAGAEAYSRMLTSVYREIYRPEETPNYRARVIGSTRRLLNKRENKDRARRDIYGGCKDARNREFC